MRLVKWLAGMDDPTYNAMPPDDRKAFDRLILGVMLPATIAFISMFFLVRTITDRLVFQCVAGALYALCVVYIDTSTIMTALRYPPRKGGALKSFITLAFRIGLVMLMSFFATIPLKSEIFRDYIEREQRKEAYNELQSSKHSNDALNKDAYESDVETHKSNLKFCQDRVGNLREQRDAFVVARDRERVCMEREAKTGEGPRFIACQTRHKEAIAKIEGLDQEIGQQQVCIQQATRAVADLRREQRGTARKRTSEDEARLHERDKGAMDFITLYSLLKTYEDKNTNVYWLSFALFWLIVVLELYPILVKMLYHSRGDGLSEFFARVRGDSEAVDVHRLRSEEQSYKASLEHLRKRGRFLIEASGVAYQSSKHAVKHLGTTTSQTPLDAPAPRERVEVPDTTASVDDERPRTNNAEPPPKQSPPMAYTAHETEDDDGFTSVF